MKKMGIILIMILTGISLYAFGGADYTLEQPIQYKNVTVWPIKANIPLDTTQYITLSEGLEAGTVIVSEIGGDEAMDYPDFNENYTENEIFSNPDLMNNEAYYFDNEEDPLDETEINETFFELNTPDDLDEYTEPDVSEEVVEQQYDQYQIQNNEPVFQQQMMMGGGAQVNTLQIENKSGKYLFLMAGELITGGRQNRTLQVDAIIPPSDKPVPIDVFCVEQSRWSADSSKENPSQFDFSVNTAAESTLRKTIISKAEQSAVWDSVEEINNERGFETTNYIVNAEDTSQQDKLDEYYENIGPKITGDTIVGFIVMSNGAIIGGDMINNKGLFQSLKEKLLRSYLFEAAFSEETAAVSGSNATKEAQDFLTAMVEAKETGTSDTPTHSSDSGLTYKQTETEDLVGSYTEIEDSEFKGPLKSTFFVK